MPTRSFVDGAAMLGAIEALSAGKPQRATNWAIRSAVEVTTSLLLVPSVTLSPIPESHNSPVGRSAARFSVSWPVLVVQRLQTRIWAADLTRNLALGDESQRDERFGTRPSEPS